MHKILIISLLIFSLNPNAIAQNAEINHLFELYIKIQDKIARNELLVNEFSLNQNNLKWNQQLRYQRQEKYYYYFNQAKEPILSFLIVKIDSNQYFHQTEYLLNGQGELIFCREKQNNPKYAYTELQTFYKNNQLIRLLEDNKTILSSTIFHSQKIAYFQKTIRWYEEKFKLNFKKRETLGKE